jgi:hypothetical protein
VRFSYNAGVLVGITLVHLDVLAPNEEVPEMAVLVPNRIHAQMVHPPSYSSGPGPGPGRAVFLGPLAPARPQRRRLHRPAHAARMRKLQASVCGGSEWEMMVVDVETLLRFSLESCKSIFYF